MFPEPTDVALRRRFLIVKINHLAERIDPYIPQPIADSAAVLYQIPDAGLHSGHITHIANIVNATPMPVEAQPLRVRLSDALADLELTLPPAPPPFVAPPPPAVIITMPSAKQPSARRGRFTRLLAAIRKLLRREPTFSPEARRAAAAIMSCAPSARPM